MRRAAGPGVERVPIKGILFDKDGTLLDFHATWVPAFRSAATAVSREVGRPELADALLSIGGYDHASGRCQPGQALASGTNHEIARLWGQVCGIADHAALLARIEAIFACEAAGRPVPVGDLASLFTRLIDRGLQLGMATMDSEALAHATVSRLEIGAFLSFVCGYDSGFGVKPEAGMVRAFCERLDLEPAEVLVVGDTLHDLHMGRAAGAGLVVGVLSGTGSRELFEPHCDHILDDVLALESVLSL
jgi:phosphoglycolate phosphatase